MSAPRPYTPENWLSTVCRKAVGGIRRRGLSTAISRTLGIEDLLQVGRFAVLENGGSDEGLAVTVARRAMVRAIEREAIRQRGAVEVRAGHEFASSGEEPSWGDMWDATVHHGEHLRPVPENYDLWKAMASLNPQEYRAVSLTFWDDLSQCEIADDLGISQRHVSRIIDIALQKLKEKCLNRQPRVITNMRGK
jgi:RNA polymerase sigma factor (sigma-70 family)